MKRHRFLPAAVLILAGLPAAAEPAKPAKSSNPPPASDLPGPQTLVQVQDVPGLPRVLLLGDSCSMGYTLDTRELLKGVANVHRPPEHCGETRTARTKLTKWLGTGKWDVIHFNWGMHDFKLDTGSHLVPIGEYEANLRELVKEMKATGAKLIWATTCPIPEGKLAPRRKMGDEIAYNAVALKVMRENGVAIDDLYALSKPRLAELQMPANVHFTPTGYRVLAEQVAASIKDALAAKP